MEHDRPVTGQQPLRVDAYIRPELLIDPVDARLRIVETLHEEETIDQLNIEVWPPKVPLTETSFTEVIEVFDRFTEWARSNGVSIQPPFQVCEVTSTFTGETKTVLRLPGLCLAVYVDGTLENVIPHTMEGTQYTIDEAIQALQSDEVPTDPIDESIPAQ